MPVGLFCWAPSARLSATSCAGHMYVQGDVANDPASHLVARATESSVRLVVMESLRSGVAVDYQRLVELSLEPVPAPAPPAVTAPPSDPPSAGLLAAGAPLPRAGKSLPVIEIFG